MKKVLGTILFVAYAIVAITVTVLLLSYNEYNNSKLGGYTVYIVKDDSLEPEYKQGSILLIKSTSDKNVQIGDELFLYRVLNSQEYEVVDRTLQEKKQQGNHIVYGVDGEESYANDYFIGRAKDTVVIEGWGYILGLLESKWGYLFCVVIVSLLLFLQEVFELYMEIRDTSARKKSNAVEGEYEKANNEENKHEEHKVKTKSAKAVTKTAGTKSTKSKATTTKAKNNTTAKTTPNIKTTSENISSVKKATPKKSVAKSSKKEE